MTNGTTDAFGAHRANHTISDIIRYTKQYNEPVYDFEGRDGIRHRVYVVKSDRDIDNISNAYNYVKELYIADGHHRAASAVRVAKKRREANLEVSQTSV